MDTLEILLDYRALSAMYAAQPVIGDFVFTNDFYQNPQDAISDDVELIYFDQAKVPAPVSARGSAARVLQLGGGAKRYASLFVAFNTIGLKADTLTGLRHPEVYELQEKGKQAVQIQLEYFRARHAIMKEVTFALTMSYGAVCWDAEGNLLPPTPSPNGDGSLTAATSSSMADFGFGDANRGVLEDSTDGGSIVDRLWTDSACKISRQLDRIALRSERLGRPKPTEVYVHSNTKHMLRTNTEFMTWAQYHQRSIDEVLRGGIINDLWGFNWHFVGSTWTDANGTVRDMVPQSQAIVCPKFGPWYRTFKGANQVPRDLNIVGSLEQVLDSYDTVYGQAAWAKMIDNPVQLQLFMADSYGLNFADPKVVYCPLIKETTGASGTHVSNN